MKKAELADGLSMFSDWYHHSLTHNDIQHKATTIAKTLCIFVTYVIVAEQQGVTIYDLLSDEKDTFTCAVFHSLKSSASTATIGGKCITHRPHVQVCYQIINLPQ